MSQILEMPQIISLKGQTRNELNISMISSAVAKRIDKRLNSATISVDLDYMQIGGNGLEYLLSKNAIQNVKGLSLIDNKLTPASISAFQNRPLSQLVYLSLSWSNIGDRGCRWLSRARLNCLMTLELNGVQMGDSGLSHLAKARWKYLEIISLTGNHLTGVCLRLIVLGNWYKIVKINLYANKVEYSQGLLAVISEFKLKELNVSGQRNTCGGDLKRRSAQQLKYVLTKRFGKHSVICDKA